MKRKKINCKGSALVFLLFTISVIVIIGSVALSVSVMNYKMKKLNSQMKKAFYSSEAGIDEAYMMSRQFISEAINYAFNKTKDYTEVEKQSRNVYSDMKDDLNDKNYTNEIFQSYFKNYLKGTCMDVDSTKGLINLLNNSTSYLIYENGYPRIAASLIENPNDFLVEVKSTYIYQNIKKEIVLKLKVDIPKYDDETIRFGANVDELIHVIDWKIEREI
ncbi:hypothetical protein [Brassicibacter mesophilus]|uniref:hypothetical protein n=1 Tax=Brassicibacter mesophilus TaxID=745119 RepID=UPI003D1DB411